MTKTDLLLSIILAIQLLQFPVEVSIVYFPDRCIVHPIVFFLRVYLKLGSNGRATS